MTQAALQEEAEEAEEALGLSNLLVGLQLLEDRLGTIPPLGQCAGDDTPRLTKSFPKGQLCLSCDVTRRFDVPPLCKLQVVHRSFWHFCHSWPAIVIKVVMHT